MTKLTRIMCTICFLGFCMSLMDSLLACCFAVNTSNMLLIVVSMMLFGCLLVMMNIFLQSCILSMLGVLLLFIGSACMLTDALGKSGRDKLPTVSVVNFNFLPEVAYITALIFELLQANYTNNISANEHFLDNMYRIVSIKPIRRR